MMKEHGNEQSKALPALSLRAWGKGFLLCATLLVAFVAETSACTNLIVGKNASADGSTIVSYSADSYGLFGQLYHYPAATYKKGTMLDVYEWDTNKYLGQIEQAHQTYNVIGNMNEFQVTIGETTFSGRPELVDTTGIIDYGSLIYIGLQRSRTAREAIKVMTGLVKEYGYYSSGESFTIADPNEIWILEMIGKGAGIRGAVWVAVRVPDDCISAHANQSRIHQFNMDDKENCLYSSDVISFAREKGYFNGINKDFSFADAYAPLDFGGRRFCEARVWSYFNKFIDNGADYLPYIQGKTNEPMPLFVKPNRKISVQDVKNAMRDHYEGTPLDISNDFGAGPYKTPYRLSPLTFKVGDQKYFNERPISTQQTGFVFVAQMRAEKPDAIGGVLWFGLDDANMTVFTPVYCCTDKVPACYAPNGADYITFSWDSSFWIFNWVANMVYPRYSLMIDDVRATQKELETTFNLAQEGVEATAAKLYAKDPAEAKAFLTRYTGITAQSAFDTWKRLGEYLIVKYNDGVVKRVKNGQFERNSIGEPASVVRPGYPKKFLEEYVKQTGDRYKVTN
ncbi:C69 family dipeptidase [uncultured Bacteroides sp.]|uniref:C69 family dipeptidase n=1 Tax=uncultured Bacteroides sp. TaxID=162156 RepID=UPI002AABD626|nr:C69 family dipeptidase [uncultured Bacteroides sp.]